VPCESVHLALQQLIEAEATERIGAGRYQRSEARRTDHNGSRPKQIATQAGDVQLRIPKLRPGVVLPCDPRAPPPDRPGALCGRHGAYVQDVSTRSVGDLVAAMGIDSGISKSEVSRICAGLHETVGAFRTRPLDHVASRTRSRRHLPPRPNHASMVLSMAVIVATGVTATGDREILGLDVGDSEDEVFWKGVMTSPKQRGLAGVQLVISDQHSRLVAALTKAFQGVAHPRCRVHFARNLLALVPKAEADNVAAASRVVFGSPPSRARSRRR
jgi:putative transposase